MLPDVGSRRVRPWELQALGVYGRNDYSFLPATRETNIGTVNQAARLTVYYDGREESGYETGFGALAAERRTEQSRIRFIQSVFQTAERESFDVLGQYFLSELERDPGGDTFDEGQTFGVAASCNTAATNSGRAWSALRSKEATS